LNNLESKNFDNDFKYLPEFIKTARISNKKYSQRYESAFKEVFGEAVTFPQLLVFEDSFPFSALGNRSMIVISTKNFELLDEEEIAFTLYHEIGHLIFANEYEKAFFNNDLETLQLIELKCDLIAVILGKSIKLDADDYISALKKVYNFEIKNNQNKDRLNMYPKLELRVSLIKNAARNF
jgi:hypothetical protein